MTNSWDVSSMDGYVGVATSPEHNVTFRLLTPHVRVPVNPFARAVTQDILPRLALIHQADSQTPAPDPASLPRRLSQDDVCEMADRAAAADGFAASAYVAQCRARGATLSAVYLELLAPAARLLGDWWLGDTMSFAEVTIGMVRLHRTMGELGAEFRGARRERVGRTVILTAAPGEQHVFGLAMLSDFFRRAGWAVRTPTSATQPAILEMVAREPCAVLGMSASCGDRLDDIARLLRQIRLASQNPQIGIMIGGPAFADAALAAQVGADATASDAAHAVAQAERLLGLQRSSG